MCAIVYITALDTKDHSFVNTGCKIAFASESISNTMEQIVPGSAEAKTQWQLQSRLYADHIAQVLVGLIAASICVSWWLPDLSCSVFSRVIAAQSVQRKKS